MELPDIYRPITTGWTDQTKEHVMQQTDLEGRKPCDLCWESARDIGVYAWPVENGKFERCQCGRVLKAIPLDMES